MFKFGDKVKIKDLGYKGIVVAVLTEFSGTTYKVRYFHNGEAKEIYFFDWELDAGS